MTLRNEIAAGIDRGELRHGDPDQLSLACWSLVHGLSTLLINGAVRHPPTAAAERDLATALLLILGEGTFTTTPDRKRS
jgi:hypothetical protein